MAEKKQSNLLVLDILRENSDENHILSVKDIQALLEARYGLVLERRAIYSNLEILAQQGYEISDFKDNGKGYYLVSRQFDKGEVLLLCNAIHASHFISQKQSKKLIDTLLATQSKYDQKEFTDKVYMPNPQKTENKQLMFNVEIVSEAIRERKMLQFTYLRYGKDKKLVARRPEPYLVEPRYIVYADSKAYMIITSPHHDGFTHYRLDKVADAIILNEKAKRLPKDMDAYEYARNKLFMYSGEMETVTFRCDEKVMDQMIDVFGTEMNIAFGDDGFFTINVKTSEPGAMYLAQQFMEYIEIIKPVELRDSFRNNLKQTLKKYK
nr:WYL domain-containing protein [Clostridia bacterium]